MNMPSLKEQRVHLVILSVLDPTWIDEYEIADESQRRLLELAPRFIPSPKYRYAVVPRNVRGEWVLSLYQCPVEELYPEWPSPKPQVVDA